MPRRTTMMLTTLTVLVAGVTQAQVPAPVAQTVVYEGARVWTGSGFARRDVAVRGARVIPVSQAGRNARRIQLSGRFIVPAYANAHAHITNATPQGSRAYTDVGVFYVWNPNTIVMGPDAQAFWARPDTYDVRVAQGGITEPGGHPERLYVEYLARSVYEGRPREWFVGNAFHYGATREEIDTALDRLRSQGANFVKAYLLNSDRYAALRDDPRAYGGRGLNPDNMAYLVAQAHARGLPVAVHVETAHDLEVAARAGADVAAHLPGYDNDDSGEALARRRLTPRIAAAVASAGMRVTPTYALVRGGTYGQAGPLADVPAERIAVQRENLRLLRAAGVRVLMGTDRSGEIFTEAEHWVEIGALSSAQAAAAVFATGPALFPDRRIGCLQVGCEADFLVLAADPTTDIRHLRRIERRIMQGAELPAPQPAPPAAGTASPAGA